MAIKLMYITNRADVAKIVDSVGVERVFVDLERLGKAERQKNIDSVKSMHTIEDIKNVRGAVKNAELLVRINPMHEAIGEYCSSAEEIEQVIAAGADLIMLPYFKTLEEVKSFMKMVAGRVKVVLLVETPEAVGLIDEILEIPGIDELFVGLHDLSLGYEKTFLFEVLSDGTVEMLCKKFEKTGIPYGFGGIASLGKGLLPAEYVIKEHYRMGSTCAILSRSFCDIQFMDSIDEIEKVFEKGVRDIREFEKTCQDCDETEYNENKKIVAERVAMIAQKLAEK